MLRHPRWHARRQRWRVIRRRLRLIEAVWWDHAGWWRAPGRLSKWNIVCSCGLCRDEKYRDGRQRDRRNAERRDRAAYGPWCHSGTEIGANSTERDG